VKVYQHCKLMKVISTNNTIEAVETIRGKIKCKYFVNCTGFWARSVGKLSEPYVKVSKHVFFYY
jgi:pyruvate dehydrogenase phosphatase regulatory subunit